MKNLTITILTVGLTAVLFTGCLTACSASAKGAEMNNAAKIEQNEANKELKERIWREGKREQEERR